MNFLIFCIMIFTFGFFVGVAIGLLCVELFKKEPPETAEEMVKLYHFRVAWDEEEEEYKGTCKEFPSLSWFSADASRAYEGIHTLTEKTIRDMIANKEELPL